MNQSFWAGKRVFLTGHTGFMGGWLSMLLKDLGAECTGYALPAPTQPSLYDLAKVGQDMRSIQGDVRDLEHLTKSLREAEPEIVFHLAAQALVRRSYAEPVETYATNVLGTVHLLEAVRAAGTVKAVINITSDKCYENREWIWGYRETDPMGGFDPYSSSKGCAELVTDAYRRSYFDVPGGPALASVRAGNVIGGGDWAEDRLIPDFVRAMAANQPLRVRNPNAVRPWQHVLEPVRGYLMLAERLVASRKDFSGGWNFGPQDSDTKPVDWIVQRLAASWGPDMTWTVDPGPHPHEAHYLKLDCSKAHQQLGWNPRWGLARSLDEIVAWYRAWLAGKDMAEVTRLQIQSYLRDATQYAHLPQL